MKKMIGTFKRIILLAALLIVLTGCGAAEPDSEGAGAAEMPRQEQSESQDESAPQNQSALQDTDEDMEVDPVDADFEEEAGGATAETEPEQYALIDPEGMTLEMRVRTPEGYARTEEADGSLAQFLRAYPVEADGAPVLLYDGREKGNQSAHAAVFKLPIEARDLQQCADSVMRVYAEYFWQTGQYERIAFHFTNGFLAEYSRWRDGKRIAVDGNTVSWVASAGYDDSYECFQEYLQMVFSYAGTLSMDGEAAPIELTDIRVGDVFLHGGSPGHVVMVVDVCEDGSGNKAFLLAQGYMPAQQFHLLKNPMHGDDPWYYADELTYPLQTPEYTFYEGSLKRLGY